MARSFFGQRISNDCVREPWLLNVSLGSREFALGVKALERFVRNQERESKRTSASARFLPSREAEGIEKLHTRKVLLVVRDNNTIVDLRNRGNDYVERASRSTCGRPLGHEASPDKSCSFIKGQDSPTKKTLRTFRACKPLFKLFTILPDGLLQYAAPDLCQTQGGNEQVVIWLLCHPFQELRGRNRFGDVADDVCVQEVPHQRSTFLPESNGRSILISAPTRGERRSAARIPPFRDTSETVRITSRRIRVASGSSCASLFARERIRLRSVSRPRTSNRARPFFSSRLRKFLTARFWAVLLISHLARISSNISRIGQHCKLTLAWYVLMPMWNLTSLLPVDPDLWKRTRRRSRTRKRTERPIPSFSYPRK
jgi:hypothetical protein